MDPLSPNKSLFWSKVQNRLFKSLTIVQATRYPVLLLCLDHRPLGDSGCGEISTLYSSLIWPIFNLFFQVGQPDVVLSLMPLYRTCPPWTNSTNFELKSTSTSASPATSPMINSSIETSSLLISHTESTMQTQAICYALLFLHVLPFIGYLQIVFN